MDTSGIQHIIDNQKPTSKEAVDQYYSLMDHVQSNKNKDPAKAFQYAMVSLSYLKPLIESNVQQYGSFDIGKIPALEFFGEYAAKMSMDGQLQNAVDLIEYFPELEVMKPHVEKWMAIVEARKKLVPVIKENPGILQSKLWKKADVDSKIGSYAVMGLVNQGVLKHEKSGKSYALEYVG